MDILYKDLLQASCRLSRAIGRTVYCRLSGPKIIIGLGRFFQSHAMLLVMSGFILSSEAQRQQDFFNNTVAFVTLIYPRLLLQNEACHQGIYRK